MSELFQDERNQVLFGDILAAVKEVVVQHVYTSGPVIMKQTPCLLVLEDVGLALQGGIIAWYDTRELSLEQLPALAARISELFNRLSIESIKPSRN